MNLSVSESLDQPERSFSPERVKVFITVDTEHSIGGAFSNPDLSPVGNEKRILGKIGGKSYGIPLIMDIGDHYGLRFTFFVEVFNRYFFGEGATRQVLEYIRKRGHDIQLHLHPNYLNFTLDAPQDLHFSDLLGEYPFDRQVEMLAQARQWLRDYGLENVTAFRAGCYGANPATLAALALAGFLIDSSYNRAFLHGPCLLPEWDINDVNEHDGIFEFPVTNFVEKTGLRSSRFMPLDINGVSFEEMRHSLYEARAGRGPRNITVILHSFSFVRPRDVQYQKAVPRHHVIRRFKKLCRFLAENSRDFCVMTLGELNRRQLEQLDAGAKNIFPNVPGRLSVLRFCGQLWDRIG